MRKRRLRIERAVLARAGTSIRGTLPLASGGRRQAAGEADPVVRIDVVVGQHHDAEQPVDVREEPRELAAHLLDVIRVDAGRESRHARVVHPPDERLGAETQAPA
jgi:hypothetical protein